MSIEALERAYIPGELEITQMVNKQTILENMPKIAYLKDDYNEGYRVGRTEQVELHREGDQS
jgi:hypothetical protein